MATIFITGGGRGVGLALARQYLAAGDAVMLGVRDSARASALLPEAQTFALDQREARSVAVLGAALAGATIDTLVNNAGVIGPERQSIADMDFDGFAETLLVNTLGPLRVTQALLPALRRSRAARVINVTSAMGSLSYAKSDRVAYRASKAAANKITQCMATDLAAEGVAVAAVHPGWVRTDMGGPGADLDPEDSARGLRGVIDRLTLAATGRFWNYDGATLDW